MLKQTIKSIFPAMALAALILSACGSAATATPTAAVDAIYTVAAQTIEAKQTQSTVTPAPSNTPAPTNTNLPTIPVIVTTAPAVSTSVTNNYCDNSVYLADVTIPDNTVIAAGQAFVKTWSFQNTGTCTWTSDGYTIIFSNGDVMSGVTRPVGSTVPPQGSASISVNLVAPNTAGTYKGFWRLANGKGQPFGQTVSVIIVVGSTTTTVTSTITPGGPTLTPTITKTSGPSSTPANTVTATNTLVPSKAPPTVAPSDTPTPTATETPVTPAASN